MDEVRQPVDAAELDELTVDPQLAEERRAERRPGRKRGERGADLAIGLGVVRVVGEPERVDAEAPLGRRQGGKRPLDRAVARDQAPSQNRDEGRRRCGHADRHEKSATGPRPEPRARDQQRCAEPCADPRAVGLDRRTPAARELGHAASADLRLR